MALLEAEVERLKETLVRQENENYECVAILKDENRKLKHQATSQSTRSTDNDRGNKTPTKREIAALSTEYDLLQKQVNELKLYIKQN